MASGVVQFYFLITGAPAQCTRAVQTPELRRTVAHGAVQCRIEENLVNNYCHLILMIEMECDNLMIGDHQLFGERYRLFFIVIGSQRIRVD